MRVFAFTCLLFNVYDLLSIKLDFELVFRYYNKNVHKFIAQSTNNVQIIPLCLINSIQLLLYVFVLENILILLK